MDQKGIDRINALSRKQKAEGLTPEEKEEQQRLRQQFLADFRKSFRSRLDNIEIEYPDGRVVSLKEQHDKKYQ